MRRVVIMSWRSSVNGRWGFLLGGRTVDGLTGDHPDTDDECPHGKPEVSDFRTAPCGWERGSNVGKKGAVCLMGSVVHALCTVEVVRQGSSRVEAVGFGAFSLHGTGHARGEWTFHPNSHENPSQPLLWGKPCLRDRVGRGSDKRVHRLHSRAKTTGACESRQPNGENR